MLWREKRKATDAVKERDKRLFHDNLTHQVSHPSKEVRFVALKI